MKEIIYISQDIEYLEPFLNTCDVIDLDPFVYLDYLALEIEEKPLALTEAALIAHEAIYQSVFEDAKLLSEAAKANLFHATAFLLLELQKVFKRDNISPAFYRLSFNRTVGDTRLVIKLLPRA